MIKALSKREELYLPVICSEFLDRTYRPMDDPVVLSAKRIRTTLNPAFGDDDLPELKLPFDEGTTLNGS